MVEVLSLNEEAAQSRNARLWALYAGGEDLSPQALGEPTPPGSHPAGPEADPEAARQRFRGFRLEDAAGPREAPAQLRELCRQWLRPEAHSKEQMLEALVLEQLLGALPAKLRVWVESQHPEDCQEVVALVEDMTWASEEKGGCRARVQSPPGGILEDWVGGARASTRGPLHPRVLNRSWRASLPWPPDQGFASPSGQAVGTEVSGPTPVVEPGLYLCVYICLYPVQGACPHAAQGSSP